MSSLEKSDSEIPCIATLRDPKAETAYCTLLMKRCINRYDGQPRPARIGMQPTLAAPYGIPIVKVPFQLKVINFILN